MATPLTLTQLFNVREMDGIISDDTTYIGIDFGTSTTVVSMAAFNPRTRGIECRSLQLSQTDQNGNEMFGEIYPTVIAQLDSGRPLFGQGAYDVKWHPDFTFGHNLWHSFKMELGKDLGNRWYASQQQKIKNPKDATILFFRFLKRSIEKYVQTEGLPAKIKYAVSIPASFESNQRQDLMSAIKTNGIQLTNSLLIDEPNAAFLGYINSPETDHIQLSDHYDPKVMVFDFGAGTCDISLLKISADYQGIHSSNLSISQFAELGGNDIDRYIAHNILLPQLLKANGKPDNLFTTKETQVIVDQLMSHAENMKKRICDERFAYLLEEPEILDEKVKSGEGLTLDASKLSIHSNDGMLTIDQLSLSYDDFIKTMEVFFKRTLGSGITVGNQKKYNNIHTAIESALTKAHVSRGEVDYVVMIGGSSRNPFVQKKIREAFPKSRVLIPRELQSLVSQGAAIHSILSNGLGIQAVRPIVSETIIVVTQTGNLPVIPAGTEVPFKYRMADKVTTGNKEYGQIEIPVCVGSDKKVLHNLVLKNNDGQPFSPHTNVTLNFEMDSDKILHVYAEANGNTWEANCLNPLDNAAMTDAEVKIMSAQRDSYNSAACNGNKPTAQSLDALSKAYEDNDQEVLAAETLVEKFQLYPETALYNRIAVLYHNGGDYRSAIRYLKLAHEAAPNNAVVNNNLGHDLQIVGQLKEARGYIERAIELKADYAIAMVTLAKIEAVEGNNDKSDALYRQAYNIFKGKWLEDRLNDVEKGWFITAAVKVGDKDTVTKLRRELDKSQHSAAYSIDNTLFENR